ncbi:MAG: hypothetical protein IIY06_10675 [Proteobacteria bacterium]|nr:hypothetical protein [Pseudomonadota bacterium]
MDYLYEDYDGDIIDRAADFLTDMLSQMGFTADIYTEVIDNTVVFDIVGDDVKSLSPDVNPDVINALSWLIKRARFAIGSEIRFDIDVNGYRLKRVHELEGVSAELHEKMQDKCSQIQIFGMNNVDRRALHLLLNADPTVATQSNGYGAFRHLEIRKNGE